MRILSISFVLGLLAAGAIATPAAPKCSINPTLRTALSKAAPLASAFCSAYTKTTHHQAAPLPTYFKACKNIPSEISSICSCFVTKTCTSKTTHATTLATCAAVPSSCRATVTLTAPKSTVTVPVTVVRTSLSEKDVTATATVTVVQTATQEIDVTRTVTSASEFDVTRSLTFTATQIQELDVTVTQVSVSEYDVTRTVISSITQTKEVDFTSTVVSTSTFFVTQTATATITATQTEEIDFTSTVTSVSEYDVTRTVTATVTATQTQENDVTQTVTATQTQEFDFTSTVSSTIVSYSATTVTQCPPTPSSYKISASFLVGGRTKKFWLQDAVTNYNPNNPHYLQLGSDIYSGSNFQFSPQNQLILPAYNLYSEQSTSNGYNIIYFQQMPISDSYATTYFTLNADMSVTVTDPSKGATFLQACCGASTFLALYPTDQGYPTITLQAVPA